MPDGASCAVACALAWLGGTRRFMGEDRSVGFHAAYVLKSYGPIESGSGNAILGAYLNQLGLSENAILYITQDARPTSIQWMSLQDAERARDCGFGVVAAESTPGSALAGERGPKRRQPRTARDRFRARADRAVVEAERRSRARTRGPCTRTPLSITAIRRRGEAVLRSKNRIADRWTDAFLHHPPGLDLGDLCQGGQDRAASKAS